MRTLLHLKTILRRVDALGAYNQFGRTIDEIFGDECDFETALLICGKLFRGSEYFLKIIRGSESFEAIQIYDPLQSITFPLAEIDAYNPASRGPPNYAVTFGHRELEFANGNEELIKWIKDNFPSVRGQALSQNPDDDRHQDAEDYRYQDEDVNPPYLDRSEN